jgi:hypothetical protein
MKSRIFFITYIAANVGLITYGIIALIQPDILLEPFLAHVYQFPAEATRATIYLSALYRLLGYFNIIPGVFGLLILHRYWVTRQAWYLNVVIVSTILTYLGPVVFDNTIGTIGFFELLEHILFVLVLISGFFMLRQGNSIAPLSSSSSSSEKMAQTEKKSSFLTSQNPAGGLNTNSER